jgi:hypothetical protein
MTRELYQVEYVLRNISPTLLWRLISTPSGLSEWFADDVTEDRNGILSFQWGNTAQKAEKISVSTGNIRYHWIEDPDSYYFEFHIDQSELTGGIVLHISDFAEPGDLNSSIGLWNSQIDTLMRRIGM